jgi:hypothetical protein
MFSSQFQSRKVVLVEDILLSYLDTRDLLRIKQVCKEWLVAVREYIRRLKTTGELQLRLEAAWLNTQPRFSIKEIPNCIVRQMEICPMTGNMAILSDKCVLFCDPLSLKILYKNPLPQANTLRSLLYSSVAPKALVFAGNQVLILRRFNCTQVYKRIGDNPNLVPVSINPTLNFDAIERGLICTTKENIIAWDISLGHLVIHRLGDICEGSGQKAPPNLDGSHCIQYDAVSDLIVAVKPVSTSSFVFTTCQGNFSNVRSIGPFCLDFYTSRPSKLFVRYPLVAIIFEYVDGYSVYNLETKVRYRLARREFFNDLVFVDSHTILYSVSNSTSSTHSVVYAQSIKNLHLMPYVVINVPRGRTRLSVVGTRLYIYSDNQYSRDDWLFVVDCWNQDSFEADEQEDKQEISGQ